MRSKLLVLAGFLLCAMVPPRTHGSCKLWENLKLAQESAASAARALQGVVMPKETEQRLSRLIALAMLENPGLSAAQAMADAYAQLDPADQAAAAAWYAAKRARDLADDAAEKALKEYAAEMNRKDQALNRAEAEFEVEVKFLDAERAAIKSMPRDDAYLERVSKLCERLKKAYHKMLSDLQPFRECFPDVEAFAHDKEDRLLRIDALEAEIARRRGNPGSDGPTTAGSGSTQSDGSVAKPLDGEPPPPGPLGDAYVIRAPKVSGVRGKLTRVNADGFEFQVRKDDGSMAVAGVRIKQAPPGTVRVNERVQLVAEAYGELPAFSYGCWELNNVIAGQIPSDNGCGSTNHFKGTGNPHVATVTFYFGVGQNPYIRFYGGQFNSPDGTEMDIVWEVVPK